MNIVIALVFLFAIIYSILLAVECFIFIIRVSQGKEAKVTDGQMVIPSLFWAIFYYLTHLV